MLARADPAFDGSVILLQDVIETLHRSMSAVLLQSTFGFELPFAHERGAGHRLRRRRARVPGRGGGVTDLPGGAVVRPRVRDRIPRVALAADCCRGIRQPGTTRAPVMS